MMGRNLAFLSELAWETLMIDRGRADSHNYLWFPEACEGTPMNRGWRLGDIQKLLR